MDICTLGSEKRGEDTKKEKRSTRRRCQGLVRINNYIGMLTITLAFFFGSQD